MWASVKNSAATVSGPARIGSIDYVAGTWLRARRVIVKAGHSSFGPNPRFVVTNLHRLQSPVFMKCPG